MDKLELKDKVRLLMFYDNKKSLLENKMLINEQSVVGAPNYGTMDQKKDVLSKNDNSYPKYCRYPERAIIPGKNEVGVSGIEAIPEGYCCYPSPLPLSEKGGTTTIFIPYDAEVTFWNEVNFDFFLKKHMEKNNFPVEFENGLSRYYLRIFQFGTVHSFKISGLTYTSWLTYPNNSEFGVFKWFYNTNNQKPYPKVKWTDPRNQWQKIVDDWGNVAQWVSAAAFAIGGFFTAGSTWLLVAEIVGEGALGIILAQRELEKGENIAAAFDLLFAATPFLKTSKFFTGIDQKVAKNLTRSMRKAGLNKNSKPEEILNWYRSLSLEEKNLWAKMVQAGDEFSEAGLKMVLGNGLNELQKYIKSNPKIVKNIKWVNNVNIREWGVQGFTGIMDILAEIFYGDKLDDKEKKKLTTIFNNAQNISDELAKEVLANLTANAESIKEFLGSPLTNEMLKELDLMPEGKPHADWFNTSLKDSLNSVGEDYHELPSDENKSLPDVQISKEDISGYLSDGYKRANELTKEEWEIANSPKKLNGEWYWKVK